MKEASIITVAILAVALLAFAFSGAGCTRTGWEERHVPTTDAERQAVKECTERIMAATPLELSGKRQGWDDAVAEAGRQARMNACRPTYWEYKFYCGYCVTEYTGRWHYDRNVDNGQPQYMPSGHK